MRWLAVAMLLWLRCCWPFFCCCTCGHSDTWKIPKFKKVCKIRVTHKIHQLLHFLTLNINLDFWRQFCYIIFQFPYWHLINSKIILMENKWMKAKHFFFLSFNRCSQSFAEKSPVTKLWSRVKCCPSNASKEGLETQVFWKEGREEGRRPFVCNVASKKGLRAFGWRLKRAT